MSYFAMPSLLSTKNGNFSVINYWGSTVGCTKKAGIKRTNNSRFYTDLEFVRPIYFAKNVKKNWSENLPFFGRVPELKILKVI